MMDGFGMGFGGAFMWLVWITLVLAIVWVVGQMRSDGARRARSPRELLDERYARGEIDEDDYQRRRATMGD